MVGLPAMKAMWGPDTLEGVASTLLLKDEEESGIREEEGMRLSSRGGRRSKYSSDAGLGVHQGAGAAGPVLRGGGWAECPGHKRGRGAQVQVPAGPEDSLGAHCLPPAQGPP